MLEMLFQKASEKLVKDSSVHHHETAKQDFVGAMLPKMLQWKLNLSDDKANLSASCS